VVPFQKDQAKASAQKAETQELDTLNLPTFSCKTEGKSDWRMPTITAWATVPFIMHPVFLMFCSISVIKATCHLSTLGCDPVWEDKKIEAMIYLLTFL